VAAGKANGIDPNVLVGMAMKESTLDPTAQSQTSTASGLFQLTASIQNAYGLSKADATGSSPSAITSQVSATAGYLHDLMGGRVPSSHPSHQLEIAIGYFRGSRNGVNRAMASKGGYNAMLKLRYGGESLGRYIKYVESYQ
jgi:transglycosylase-like protein with SLT domain